MVKILVFLTRLQHSHSFSFFSFISDLFKFLKAQSSAQTKSGMGMNSSYVDWRTRLILYRCAWIMWKNSAGYKVRVREGASTWKKFNELPAKQMNDPEQLVLTVWSLRVVLGFDHKAHVFRSLAWNFWYAESNYVSHPQSWSSTACQPKQRASWVVICWKNIKL